MRYTIKLGLSARRGLRKLPDEVYRRVATKLESLVENPRPKDIVKLAGKPLWRVRVGRYRIVYHIDDDNRHITVTAIAHRREVYR